MGTCNSSLSDEIGSRWPGFSCLDCFSELTQHLRVLIPLVSITVHWNRSKGGGMAMEGGGGGRAIGGGAVVVSSTSEVWLTQVAWVCPVSSREKNNTKRNLVRVTTKSKSRTQTVSNGHCHNLVLEPSPIYHYSLTSPGFTPSSPPRAPQATPIGSNHT